MKFIKLTTYNTEEEIDNIISEFDSMALSFMTKIYEMQKHISFDTEENITVMYAEMEDTQVNEFLSIHVKYGVKFSYEDITKSILFGNVPVINEEKIEELKALINLFIEENLNSDIVLDKINEMGVEFISEQDKKVLAIL